MGEYRLNESKDEILFNHSNTIPIIIHNIRFRSIERYMAFRKCLIFENSVDKIRQIMELPEDKILGLSKNIGKTGENSTFVSEVWDTHRTFIMFTALIAKTEYLDPVNNYYPVKTLLFNIPYNIYYPTTEDTFWGVSKEGGKNMIGILWNHIKKINNGVKQPEYDYSLIKHIYINILKNLNNDISTVMSTSADKKFIEELNAYLIPYKVKI